MTTRSLSRRLKRLEEQLVPANEEPLVIVVKYVSTDGDISEAYRLTVPDVRRKPRRW